MKLSRNSLAIKRYKRLMRIANWLAQIPAKVTPPPFRLIQIGSAFWQSRSLYVAAKLGIADELGNNERSTKSIAATLQLDEDHLYRLMRMLASIGIFVETSPGVFKNSKLSHYLMQDNPDNVRAMVLMHNSPEMAIPWMDSLEESIRDGGIPFEKTNGTDLYEYMNQNPAFDRLFSQAMDGVEHIAGTQFLDDFDWSQFDRLIDVGGSKGSKSLSILKSNPGLKAVVFDRPQVIAGAQEEWQRQGIIAELDRMEFVGGDALESIPQAESDKDVYLIMGVFHAFADADCQSVLKNLATAIGQHSCYVVIADAVAEEVNINNVIATMDMQMLMGTRGRERTLSEWKKLLEGTAMHIEQVMDIRAFVKYIVLRKDS